MSDTSTTNEPSELDLVVQRIATEVAESREVERGASLLIGQLAQALRDAAAAAEEAASDPDAPSDEAGSPVLTTLIAQLNGLADSLDAGQGDLSASVVANTPAAPDAPAAPITQEQVDAAVEAGTITLPTAPAVEGETVLEGDFEPEVQPDPPAGTADLGTPSEGNEADPAFRAPRTDTVDATVAAAEAAEADATE